MNSSLNSSPNTVVPNHDVNKTVLLPWDRFSYWVNAILVVTFDIEMGQSLESIYPSINHFKLTQNDKSNICYMSFPDSNSGFLGDTQYHFRFKQDTATRPLAETEHNESCATLTNAVPNSPQQHYTSFENYISSKTCKIVNYDDYNRKTLTGLEVDKNHLFGYVFFRQVKDKVLKEAIFKRFPFASLFNYILNLIAVEYFSNGAQAIEVACNDIDKWPLPVPGELLSLPILGHLIEVALPIKIDKYSLPLVYRREFPSVPITLPPVHEVNLYKCLQPIIIHVHLLWELILLNEPLVVIANVPSICSEMVQALTSLIWPLKYASDYRPYFTIHNTEFAEYSSKTKSPPAYVIGVTNPFFTKCLQHWPNIIKIGDAVPNKIPNFDSQKSHDPSTSQSNLSIKQAKIKKTNSIRVVDAKPAVYTRYVSYLSKDKDVLKNLIRGAESNRPPEAQSAILRRHFVDLTQSFMIPLERYFSSLMPLHKNISPFKSVPKLKEFDTDEFMRNLKQAGPELIPNLKGDLHGLYRRFFDSLNFKYWLEQKQQEAENKLELIQLQILADFDVKKWLQEKHEIEIIDQYMNLKKKLEMIETSKLEVDGHLKEKLKSIIRIFINSLPDDIRSVLISNLNHKHSSL